MRALRIVMTAIAAVAVLATPVAAAPTTGDLVSGAGWRLNSAGEKRVQFRVDAQLAGAGAGGSYSYRNPFIGLSFSGTVDCLDVRGTLAAVGGTVTKLNDPNLGVAIGDSFLIFVIDRGNPYRNGVGPDIVSQTYILPADAGNIIVPVDFPASCPDPETTEHDAFDVSGDVTVKDG
jgi:hypothetical protein